jgi:OmpA-OmpF porin, OOP family
MRVILVFALINLGGLYMLHAQNLVPNGSFEQSPGCPMGYNQRPSEFQVADWQAPTLGTPDHFHACSTGAADVPYNWAGISDAYAGEGYIGLYVWMDNDINYREFAECHLTAPLIRDSTYLVEFHYKLSSYSKYSADRMGLLLTDTLYKWKTDRAPNIEPTFHALEDSVLTARTGSWETARWEYRARGGEQFLTIGNFYDNNITQAYEIQYRNVQEPMLAMSAYYFIDDVQVVPKYLPPSGETPVAGFIAGEVEMNTRYILRRIQFEFNSYKLIGSSFDELDALAHYLITHPRVSIQLSGHTDDVGGTRYNQQLSLKRAETVSRYLQLQGVAASRIVAEGYGKTQPLVTEDSENARAVNRRVEIRFND